MMIIVVFLECVKYAYSDSRFRNLVKEETKGILLCLVITAVNIIIQKMSVALIHMCDKSASFAPTKNVDIGKIDIYRFINCAMAARNIIKHCYGMIPEHSLLIMWLIIVFGVSYISVKNKRLGVLISFCIASALCVAAPFSFGLITSIWYPQRTSLSLFFVGGMMCVFLIILYNREKTKQNLHYKIMCGYIIIIFVYIWCNTQICNVDAYISQTLDKYEAENIERYIEMYEEKSGNKVTEIASCGGGGSGMNSVYCYPNLFKQYEYACPYHRIVYDQWSQGEYINYINNTDYTVRLMENNEIDTYFGRDTKAYFNADEQLRFVGNTLFWRIY